jgi:hypothetical protein
MVAGRATPVSAGGARGGGQPGTCALARAVQSLRTFVSLARPIAVFLLLAVGGCVVPLAPDFEEEKNLPPYLVSATPAQGTLTAEKPTFSVTVQDPNEHDTLYVRWLIDYPPYDNNIHHLAQESQEPGMGATVVFEPNCIKHQISRAPQHHLMFLAADRPFLAPESAPDRPFEITPSGIYPVVAVWLFKLECP